MEFTFLKANQIKKSEQFIYHENLCYFTIVLTICSSISLTKFLFETFE